MADPTESQIRPIVTRGQTYQSDDPCRSGHTERYVRGDVCAICAREKSLRSRSTLEKSAHQRALAAARYARNREKVLKAVADYQARNRDIINAKLRAKYALNPTIKKAMRARWAAKNPHQTSAQSRLRKARNRAAEGKHTGAEIKALFKRQKGRCGWCRSSIKEGAYHADHIIALVNGGSNRISNIILSCPRCNLQKGRAHPIDFARKLGFLI